jgi:cytochrome c oxidase assembly factor CtaG
VGKTGGPSPRGSLLWLLRRPPLRALRRPGAAPVVLASVQLALHGTGGLDLLLASEVGRLLLDLLLLVTGCVVVAALFSASRVRPLEIIALLGLQVAVGVSLLVRPDVIGEEHFRSVGLTWVPDLLAEQRWAAVVWLVGTAGVAPVLIAARRGRSGRSGVPHAEAVTVA